MVDLGHHVEHEPHQVPFGQPLPHTRGQQEQLVPVARQVGVRHAQQYFESTGSAADAHLHFATACKDTETATRNGKTFSKKVPVTAAETLAEGEFNRFYARGLCLREVACH